MPCWQPQRPPRQRSSSYKLKCCLLKLGVGVFCVFQGDQAEVPVLTFFVCWAVGLVGFNWQPHVGYRGLGPLFSLTLGLSLMNELNLGENLILQNPLLLI